MNVTEALKILRDPPKREKPFDVTLACGFTPLHLQTFFAAHLQQALPARHVMVSTGLYGSLASTVEGLAERGVKNLAIAMEWSDLDARLGYRASSVWDSSTLPDILSFAGKTLQRLGNSIELLSTTSRIVISMPTLPLPPLFHTPSWQVGQSESLLAQLVAEFAMKVACMGIPIVNASRLGEESVPGRRYDLKSDLVLGLPYTVGHAEALASALALLLCPPEPKKGIITDLDETLWSGLVGEDGPDGINWDIEHHSGFFALYQTLLASLSECGVLVGVASKNDPAVVQKAFQRRDILLRQERVFPMEVHWNAKSGSVDRILRTWNIAADTVVFVDDSPLELAEVAAAHPGIECIRFPRKDYGAGYAMLRRIRDLFGKQKLSSEDSIRLDSTRRSAQFQQAASDSTQARFLQQTNAIVRFDTRGLAKDSRALELVNKTNQFNLNGIRYTESDWVSESSRPDARSMVVSYEDRFGILGKVAVILGRLDGDAVRIGVWVMSCRAFGRHIEYLCLRSYFESCQIRRIEFDFVVTNKNAPLREFLTSLLGHEPETPVVLTRERFEQICPPLYHSIAETRRPDVNGRSSEPASKVF
jgi:FkbH-like protein